MHHMYWGIGITKEGSQSTWLQFNVDQVVPVSYLCSGGSYSRRVVPGLCPGTYLLRHDLLLQYSLTEPIIDNSAYHCQTLCTHARKCGFSVIYFCIDKQYYVIGTNAVSRFGVWLHAFVRSAEDQVNNVTLQQLHDQSDNTGVVETVETMLTKEYNSNEGSHRQHLDTSQLQH